MRYIIIGLLVTMIIIPAYMISQDYMSNDSPINNVKDINDVKDINEPKRIELSDYLTEILEDSSEPKRIENIEHLTEILEDSKPNYDNIPNTIINNPPEPDILIDSIDTSDSGAWVVDGNDGLDSMTESMQSYSSLEESLQLASSRIISSEIVETVRDYSSTNIQVKDVDEPDYIKNDGRYIYMVTEDILTIIDAYPADTAKIILKINIDITGDWFEDIFLNGDTLIVFYEGYRYEQEILEYQHIPTGIYEGSATRVLTIDVTDREKPTIIDNYLIDGILMDSRMIGDHIYFVTNIELDYNNPKFPITTNDSDIIGTSDSFYFNDIGILSQFTIISAIDLTNNKINSQSFLLGDTSSFYMSKNNLYLTYQQNNKPVEKTNDEKFFDVILPILSDRLQTQIRAIINDTSLDKDERWSKIASTIQNSYNKMSTDDRDKLLEEIMTAMYTFEKESTQDLTSTIIHKIGIDGSYINYISKGHIPGRLLNQFSMDEYQDRFRVATTTERININGHSSQANAVYVMDEQLNIVGELEQIAPDEDIYSARFMGDRLYLVTFLEIDPFFVIDLTRDTPKILGELKIPGFSNYLHPFDKDHIIGIGRETTLDEFGTSELGVKIALFDVSDVNNPRVLDQVIIGDSDTYSEAEENHKAFFFDKSSKILSIPIESYVEEIFPDKETDAYWTGFFVYKLDKNGFEEKSRIYHPSTDYYLEGPRTFYIKDVLYTVSYELLKMNSIDSLKEINSIQLQNTGRLVDIMVP